MGAETAFPVDLFGSVEANGVVTGLEIPPTLAVELVAGLSTPTEIFARHNIPDYKIPGLLKSDIFRSMVREAKLEWCGDHNAESRIRAKARIALEELLIPQFAMAQDMGVPANARNDAAKFFKSLAGMDKSESGEGNGEKFVVNITLGSPDKVPETIVIDGGTTHGETSEA